MLSDFVPADEVATFSGSDVQENKEFGGQANSSSKLSRRSSSTNEKTDGGNVLKHGRIIENYESARVEKKEFACKELKRSITFMPEDEVLETNTSFETACDNADEHSLQYYSMHHHSIETSSEAPFREASLSASSKLLDDGIAAKPRLPKLIFSEHQSLPLNKKVVFSETKAAPTSIDKSDGKGRLTYSKATTDLSVTDFLGQTHHGDSAANGTQKSNQTQHGDGVSNVTKKSKINVTGIDNNQKGIDQIEEARTIQQPFYRLAMLQLIAIYIKKKTLKIRQSNAAV